MGVRDWTWAEIDPERDYSFWEIARITNITTVTLCSWRNTGRLVVYPNRSLTRGDWVIEAIRKRPAVLTEAEYKRNHRRRWPERQKARQAVTNAIKTGKLVPGVCEICGTDKGIEAHHDDYSKLLEVRWLCREHHKWLHGKRFNGILKKDGKYRMDVDNRSQK